MNYEQDHSHTHCYDGQEGHEKHLRCCVCTKDNPNIRRTGYAVKVPPQTDGCCPKCIELDGFQGALGCNNPQCECHQHPQTSHDLIEDTVRRLIRIENRVLASVIRGEDPTDSFEEVLRKTLESVVEKTRKEGFKKQAVREIEYDLGKTEGRKEALDEVENRLPKELKNPDEEEGLLLEVLSILSDMRKK